MILIIALLLIIDVVAFRLFTIHDDKTDEWFENYQ